MKKYQKYALLTVILFGLIFPLRSADALIPFEFTFPETAGKIGTWIQEKITWVQLQISSINNSKVALKIGDGLKIAREVRNCIRKVYIGKPVNKLSEYYQSFTFPESDPCSRYTKKYPFLANLLRITGQTQQILREIKNEDVYIIMDTARKVADDAVLITDLEEQREQQIQAVEDKAELDRATIDAKITMAEQNLAMLKKERDEHEGTPEEENYIKMIADATVELNMLKAKKIEIGVRATEDKARITNQFLLKINEVKERHLANSALLKKYKEERDKIRQEREAERIANALDLAIEAKKKYSADISNDVRDTMKKSLKRAENIKNDFTKNIVAALNESNDYIAYAHDPANNPEVDANLSGTGEGKKEALQGMIDNTLRQIDVIEKIINEELTSLEKRTMRIISQNINHRLDHKKQEGEKSLIIDFCRYQVGRSYTRSFKGKAENKKDKNSKDEDKKKQEDNKNKPDNNEPDNSKPETGEEW